MQVTSVHTLSFQIHRFPLGHYKVLFRRRPKGKGIFVIINILWNRASKGNLTAMYDAGYVRLCNEVEQHCLEIDELPPEVVLEMNDRFCLAVDPNSHGGWSYRCRTCANYMTPVKGFRYDLYIHFYA